MSKSPVYIDGILVDWGASFFNQSGVHHVKQVKVRGKYGDLKPKPRPVKPKDTDFADPAPAGKKARSNVAFGKQITSGNDVRARLKAVANKAPEVMVKISGGGTGMAKIKDHFDYISRNGQLEIEDEQGNITKGRADLEDIKEAWQYGGMNRIEDEGTKRQAFNIVFSMPQGTPPEAVWRAVRDFAARQFAGHRYVMALHTEETDPDKKPSPHPHVHLCVRAESDEGVRLNPRKADLQHWREGFAQALGEHGIEAAATKRQQRLQRDPGERQAVRQMRDRGKQLDRVGGRAPEPAIAKAKETDKAVAGRYAQVAKVLAASSDPDDRKLADQLKRWTEGLTRPQPGSGIEYQPRYNNTNRRRVTHGREHAAALVYQPNTGGAAAVRKTEPVAGLRNVSGIALVQNQRAHMLLQQDARDNLGQRGAARDGVRRSGAGVNRNDGRADAGLNKARDKPNDIDR